MAGALIALVVTAFAVVGLVFGVFVPYFARRIVFRSLPALPSVRVSGVVDDQRATDALLKAVDCIAEAGCWRRHEVDAVMAHGFSVVVHDAVTWQNGAGVLVAGEADLPALTLYVGSDLAALCHEFIHLCEQEIDGAPSMTHGAWDILGKLDAVDAWQAWLKGASK